MTPQKQSILSNKDKGIYGNCLVTALASYMDFPADECPQFQLLFDVKHPVNFYELAVTEWLRYWGFTKTVLLEDPYLKSGFPDYYFASGLSERGNYHLVIYKNGKLFHDPHPENSGIEPEEYWVLEKIIDHWRW